MIEKVKFQWIKECERETKISQDLLKNREEWYKEQEWNSTNSEWQNTNQNWTNNTAGNSDHFRRPNHPIGNRKPGYKRNGNSRKPQQPRPSFNTYQNQRRQFNATNEGYLRQQQEHTPITREGSITELVVENFPREFPRTFSNSHLPRGRPPNKQ